MTRWRGAGVLFRVLAPSCDLPPHSEPLYIHCTAMRTSSAANVGSDKDSEARQRAAIEEYARRENIKIKGRDGRKSGGRGAYTSDVYTGHEDRSRSLHCYVVGHPLFGTAGCGLVIAGKLAYAVYLISEGIGNDPDIQQHIGCVLASAILTKHLGHALGMEE